MRDLILMLRSLTSQSRLRVLAALWGRELSVRQVAELLHLAPGTVQRHLDALTRAGLVSVRKASHLHLYHCDQHRSDVPGGLARFVLAALADDPTITQDALQLARNLDTDRGDMRAPRSRPMTALPPDAARR